MRILIVEDEYPMRNALVKTLQAEGYRVISASDGPSGLECALTRTVDLILLDIMLPNLDGFSLCRELRQHGRKMPVLMLTARGEVDDRVEGLDCGADDYLMKPFSMRELLARVRALLRRQQLDEEVPEEIALGDVVIDFRCGLATRDGRPLELTTRELKMLRLLVAANGQAVSRERFLDEIWEYHASPTTRTVDNFVASLRSKLESSTASPKYLLTVRGVGYRLVTESKQ